MTQVFSERRLDAVIHHPTQLLAAIIGVVYTVIGIVGFFPTGAADFASESNAQLFGFGVNPLHNLVHIALGVAGIAMCLTLARARTYGWILFGVLGVAFVYGLFAVGSPSINFLSLDLADNILHLVTALLGLGIAMWPMNVRR